MLSSPRSPEHLIFDLERDVTSRVDASRRFQHPTAALFHIVFKTLAIVIYLFGGLFGQNFLTTFVLLIFLISVDFWVVKNVSGRLLVGMRWWNYVDDEGHSHWVFENKHLKGQGDLSPSSLWTPESDSTSDARIFWSGLILAPLVWSFLLIVTMFRLNIHWFVVVALALVLSLSNLYGYLRCKIGSKDVKSTFTHFLGKKIFLNFLNSKKSTDNVPPGPAFTPLSTN
ncbi:Golgi apparatus membrane protein TVP23 homolog B [Brevipalpus obovatus]|uniref:Golgi apparatus membrane protein TVP23 homolog B n=1 Tax=Brevipalpus obovatus TaxID=246614 RepID=UPI003D9DBCC8